MHDDENNISRDDRENYKFRGMFVYENRSISSYICAADCTVRAAEPSACHPKFYHMRCVDADPVFALPPLAALLSLLKIGGSML